ncbi:endonuclease/exonuclease/phosphatase (EEP) superfamily protein YafD [Kibdelosporangium banguiense]|uniref:Endonuclease/exonuclease/phosphatase (EEP) superfamily protein YafD n=1 Tax=Kibdelosporangium banguiense TaxID=1365924 RepID=A0ABS4TSU2_9PSEU|nr:endonuclease/exonuclease/phosphatase family protein [Kibdelosporangium banguiense]MBP2327020.1 endonuclease/exonuclease/phosphatase (EEP) superfamily protein YafD [Kibdelosporangium banguiense]
MSAWHWGIVAWLLFVVLHWVLSGRFWLWLLADLIPPVSYLVVPLPLLAAAAVVAPAQPWGVAGALAALVLGVGHSGLNLGALRPADQSPADAIRVLSWNTEYWYRSGTPEGLYDFLRAQRADIYVLQERILGSHADPQEAPDLPRLRAEFPRHNVVAGGELVILSRFPVLGTPPVGPAKALCAQSPWRQVYDLTKILRADLQVGKAVLSVYNVHIPVQYAPGDNVLRPSFYTRLRERNMKRLKHFRGLEADVAANPNAVLVSGDFNSTGAMRDMRRLFSRLSCANQVARHVFPWSWSRLWQLDWTLTSAVRVHEYRLGDPHGISDHRLQELLISVSHPRKASTDDRPRIPPA